jgi:hypothetical protein
MCFQCRVLLHHLEANVHDPCSYARPLEVPDPLCTTTVFLCTTPTPWLIRMHCFYVHIVLHPRLLFATRPLPPPLFPPCPPPSPSLLSLLTHVVPKPPPPSLLPTHPPRRALSSCDLFAGIWSVLFPPTHVTTPPPSPCPPSHHHTLYTLGTGLGGGEEKSWKP